MEVPRLEAESELQLQAYTTASAIPDPSCICDLCHSCGNARFLAKARNSTCTLMDTSWVLNPLSHSRNSESALLLKAQVVTVGHLDGSSELSSYFKVCKLHYTCKVPLAIYHNIFSSCRDECTSIFEGPIIFQPQTQPKV